MSNENTEEVDLGAPFFKIYDVPWVYVLEPTPWKMLQLLDLHERTQAELSEGTKVALSGIKYHLKKFMDKGLCYRITHPRPYKYHITELGKFAMETYLNYNGSLLLLESD